MNCKDWKKCEECEDDSLTTLNGVKYAKIVRNCQIIVKNVTKYMKTEYYLDYTE